MVDPYSTHLGVLAACVAATTGPVLELGVGFYSTPVLHGLCVSTKRPLVSIDSDARWLARFKGYARPGHELLTYPKPESCAALQQTWGVVFIDNGQHERRPCLKILAVRHDADRPLADKAEFVVVHDTQAPPESYGYEPMLSSFRYRHDHHAEELRFGPGLVPWTTVVSNSRPLDWLVDIFP